MACILPHPLDFIMKKGPGIDEAITGILSVICQQVRVKRSRDTREKSTSTSTLSNCEKCVLLLNVSLNEVCEKGTVPENTGMVNEIGGTHLKISCFEKCQLVGHLRIRQQVR